MLEMVLDQKGIKKAVSFAKKLFSNDQKTLTKFKMLVPEFFEDNKEK